MKAKLDKVRMQPSEELINRLLEINESLFRLNFKKALGDVDTVKHIRVQKKELARLKTVLRARALGIEGLGVKE
jgi:large subunit ribosomal protein L29